MDPKEQNGDSVNDVGKENLEEKNIGINIRKWLLEKKINEKFIINLKSPGILTVIKACRREWIGRVRLDGGRIIKELQVGKRGSGRERKKVDLD
jgi:hypothetical protein